MVIAPDLGMNIDCKAPRDRGISVSRSWPNAAIDVSFFLDGKRLANTHPDELVTRHWKRGRHAGGTALAAARARTRSARADAAEARAEATEVRVQLAALRAKYEKAKGSWAVNHKRAEGLIAGGGIVHQARVDVPARIQVRQQRGARVRAGPLCRHKVRAWIADRMGIGSHPAHSCSSQRAEDLSIRALIETHRRDQPLVLLIDDRYGLFPFELASRGVYRAVLGFYNIVNLWAEYEPADSHPSGRVVHYKCAFQLCEDQVFEHADIVAGGAMVVEGISGRPLKPDNLCFPCGTCSKKSPRVYQHAWACLYPACPAFWMASGRSLPDQLAHNPDFLSVIDFQPLPFAYRDALLPEPPVLSPKDGITTTYKYSRGWHCRKCGLLSCRSAWDQYQCPNCKDTHAIVGNVRPARSLMSIRIPISDKFVDSVVDPRSGFSATSMARVRPAGTKLLYCPTGSVSQGQNRPYTNEPAGKRRRGPDIRGVPAAGFRRNITLPSMASEKLRGPLLTNYFSQNCTSTLEKLITYVLPLNAFQSGLTIAQYIGGTDNTVPFDRALPAVIQARELIEKRILEALGLPTNSTKSSDLSAAYMEQQKMTFHSDSERGLGPVVAGLSMGSPALMHFRLLSKYAPRDEQRANTMTVVLRHGDVLVMEGAGVQDFYEYADAFLNFLGTDLNHLTLGTLWCPATSASQPWRSGLRHTTLEPRSDSQKNIGRTVRMRSQQ
ncbi:hypothetical protein FB451DRAFT_1362886 [Mycena latifolia]|nr:hypothetical protein FB451DRAFT_1362886 [Mycena latifolia]